MSGIEYIINTAKFYIGAVEGGSRHKEIIDKYNEVRPAGSYKLSYSDAWCAAFVVAIFAMCGMQALVPITAYVPSMVDVFIARKQWKWPGERSPKPGDIIFYDWNKNNESDHVGIVWKNVNGVLSVIEGNYSTSGTCAVRVISTSYPFIRGYGIPNYPAEVRDYVDYYHKLGSVYTKFIDNLGEVKNQSVGPAVFVLQTFLNVGQEGDTRITADGIFGAETRKRLVDYQVSKQLNPDGICGKQTWASFFV